MNQVKERSFKEPPKHCIVPGANFTVDWHCRTDPKYIHSFLSHAHSDHTMGLSGFKSPRILHCSQVTGKMVVIKFPKVAPVVTTHEFGHTFVIDGWSITLYEARHTPGSAMFLFISPKGKKVWHTGDFRAESPVLGAITPWAPIDHLYIDCTYGTSKLNVPPRGVCVDFISKCVIDQIPKGALCAILTYTIGKEDLIYEVAVKTNQIVFVPKPRMETIQSLLNSGWGSKEMFTDRQTQSKLHLMSIMNFDNAAAANHAYMLGYSKICIFRASGWSGKAFWQTPFHEEINGISILSYNVPYSDHCSVTELKEFVRAAKPAVFTPTTAKSKKDIDYLTKLFSPYMCRARNKNFIDFYCSPPRPLKTKDPIPNIVGVGIREEDDL